MKLILVKIGKAINVIKRDGLASGGRRVASAFLKMFGRVGSGDILFVTGGVGDSALYRTGHVAEELELHGFKCSVTVQDNPFLSSYAGKFKIFIFHRVLFTPAVQKLIRKIKERKKEIIFETDDLVYDPRHLKYMDYYQKISALEKELYKKGLGGEILKDPYVKACTTTTTYLADELKKYGKEVFVVPNKLSNKDLEIAEEIMKHKTYNIKHVTCNIKHKTYNIKQDAKCSMLHAPCSMVRIGYFSGTISHNKDFATIAGALIKILEKYPNAELFLAGPLDIADEFDKFKNRTIKVPYAPRKKHFENIARVDINLAPLEIGNPFCEAKSELKFFEAGILGVPTVAAATRAFREAVEDGVDGFVAGTEEEWVAKLEKLITDEKFRREMGAKAREKALKKHTTRNSNNRGYYEYLRSCSIS